MSNKKAQLEISANSAPAEQAFDRVEKAGRRMGDQVAKEGDKAGKALGGIGDEANKGAKGVDSATKSMIASVQRTTAALQAGERGSAKYFETLAQQRGVDVATLQPYIDQLKRVEAQQTRTGVSAAQTAAALRNVPAQFTDIAVSLQGGQAPLTVFLQQGGQLKDMFGGAGEAARALGGYVVSLVNPFSVAAAAAGALAVAYHQGSKEADAFRAALVTTGNAAGTSTNQLAGLADQLGRGFGNTVGKAADVLAQFAASGQVGRASLQDFAATAIMAEKAFGTATKDIAKNFADLGKDPVGASNRLNESMNYLTASTYAQIKAAVDMGETSKAAALAQDAYNVALKNSSTEMLANLGHIERAWGGVKSVAKEAWDAMLGVGRPVAISEQLTTAQKNLEAAIKKRKDVSDDSAFAPALDEDIAKLKEQISYVSELDRLQKRAGDTAAERVAKEQAGIQAQKDSLKYLSDEQKMRNEIAQQTATMRKAGMEEAAIQERIAQIKASYAKKGDRAQEISEYDKLNKRISEFAALQTAALDADSKLTAGQRLAVQVKQDMIAAGNKLSAADKQRLQTTLDAALAIEQRLGAEKDLAKFMDESQQLQAKAADQSDKATAALKKQAEAEREAAASVGLTKDAIAELTAAKYDDAAAGRERLANIMAEAGEPELLVKKYREEAAALRDLAAAKRERGAAEASSEAEKISKRAADRAAQDWRRAADNIERSITDALMRGFESGKSFAQVLKDTVINMFKTMVLRPSIQMVVGTGMSAAGMAPAGASAGGSALSSATQLAGMGGTMATFGSYLATGFMNTVAGSGFAASMGAAGGLASGGAVAGGAGMAVGAAIPYVAAALAVANVLGLMRSNKTVGGGLSGTLGEGDIQSYDLNRRGGSLLSGPSYSIQNLRTSEQSQALQTAFATMRTATAGMAQQLGLANESIINFTTRLGRDLIHPDTGGYGIRLDGLNPEQAAAKVQEALQTANEEMAQMVLGTFTSTGGQAARTETVYDGEGGAYQTFVAAIDPIKTWIAGPFVRANETAAQALQRLSGSLTGVNTVMDTLNQTMLDASLQGASAASALVDLFGGLQNFTNATGAYYQAFYSEAERNNETTEQLTKSLSGLGLVMPNTLQGFRALVEAQDLTTEAGRATYAALVSLSPAFAQVTNAILNQRQGLQARLDQAQGNTAALRERELASLDPSNRALQQRIWLLEDEETAMQAAVQNTDAALAAVRRAVDAEKALYQARAAVAQEQVVVAQEQVVVAQEQVAAIRGVFDTLGSAISGLLGNAATSAQAGEDFIARAIVAARTTGTLPDQQNLQGAISAATSGLNSRQYATFADEQADRLRLAAKFSELQDVAGEQLSLAERTLIASEDQLDALEEIYTEAQRQLDALEEIYTEAQRQVDVMRGLDVSIKTIPQALSLLGTTLTAELRAVASAAAAGSAAAAARTAASSAATTVPGAASSGAGYTLTTGATGATLIFPGGGSHTVAGSNAAQLLRDTYGLTAGPGGTLIRTRARGGYTPPGLTLVGEDGPEIVNFRQPSMVYTAAQSANLMGPGGPRLEALVEGLTKEVQRLQAIVNEGNYQARRTADATNGNPEQPMLVQSL
jgi:phage-related minor tail protein